MKTLLTLSLLLATTTAAFAEPALPRAADCPQLGEQLGDYLAAAKRRVGFDGEVRVQFDVNADGRAQFVSAEGSRAYRSPARIAVDSLDCRAGTPQRYVLNIRFVDPAPVAVAAAASAVVAQASPR